MDHSELFQLALETLPWVSVQAICWGRDTGNVKAGLLGAELFMLASEIGSQGYQMYDQRHKQLKELLHLVDKACSSPISTSARNKAPLSTLTKIASFKAAERASSMVKLEKEIQLLLGHFFVNSPEVPVLLKIIDEFVPPRVKESPDQEADKDTTLLETDPGYPHHVNNVLYSQLRMQIACSCRMRHLQKARLRLESGKISFDEEAIRFELLFCAGFSSSSLDLDSNSVLWQETDVFVPRKKDYGQQMKSKKSQRARFDDEPSLTSCSVALRSRKLLKTLGPGEFCRSIGKKVGSRLSFKIHDGSLRLLDGQEDPPQRNVKLVEGVSLAQLLDDASYMPMPKRVKLILAYTIAKSVWQYYNSHWMSNPWTHENIHFLEEKDRERTGYKPHPYFAVQFNNTQSQNLDFYTGQDLMFNYPNVLALAILLIEIATGQLFKSMCHSCQWNETQINENFDWAWTTAATNDLGEIFYNSYADVVKNCLDRDLFRDAPFDEASPEKNLETRQSILYSKIVLPLEVLVNAYSHDWELREIHRQPNTQVLHESWNANTQTIPFVEREPNMTTRDPNFLASDGTGTGRWTPEYWLRRIDSINGGLAYLAGNGPATTPIKVAILDTGCDMAAEYFSSFPENEERLHGHWKDWVDNERSPVDQHGHGTALAILLMRMIRNADVFVARVARNAKELQNAEDNIAKAIIYAADEWNVDIISMSFGFPAEMESIKSAIRKAEDIKKESIVFFAAAANDGANTQEMFPASMESVISVRATSSDGSFVPTYNPPPSAMKEGSPHFGTLGKDVPYDCSNDLMKKSGCSLATPIMAGITALIMEYITYKASRLEQSGCHTERIRTKRGVIELFKQMAVDKGNHRFYVAPWSLFEKAEGHRLAIVQTAIGRLPPRQQSRS